MITINTDEKIVKGTYQDDKYNYTIDFTHLNKKITSLSIMIKSGNTYIGNASIDNTGRFTISIDSIISLQDIITTITALYNDAVKTAEAD